MSGKVLCEACKESGSPVCLRKAFQGQGELLVPSGNDALWKCTQIKGALDQGTPPYIEGKIPAGFRQLSEESFLPKDEQLLEGGADDLPPPDDVSHEEGL